MNYKKITLNINGADRMLIVDPNSDTLASVLRRIGLTGTKVGCGTGVCGSCSVILDGKVIRSCTKKISAVDEYSEILTIEGIGTPRNLHPLQVAFLHNGAVQCGFCSPGFIVSAYQLLEENSNPTREDVRNWFHKHRNICRCTGYKQIVDAVMAAAKVVRGECSIEDIQVDLTKDKSYYGKSLVRPSATAKVCGVADYGDDIELKMPGSTLHVVMVQPKVTHHAKVTAIHTQEAEKMPGVYKVITHKNIKGSNRLNFFQISPYTITDEPSHMLLVEDKIFNYGDVIALVAADTIENARNAASKVTMDYEPLPEVLSFLDAAKPNATRVHENHDNIYTKQPVFKGAGNGTKELIDNAPHVVEGSFHSTREPHMSIEGDTVQAYFDEDDMLTVHCKTQAIGWNIGDLSTATGIPEEKIRVVANTTGGCFGWGVAAASYALAALACIACDNRPVALSFTYEEFMAHSGKRTPSYTNGRLACDEKGRIIGAEWEGGIDHGAYIELGDDLMYGYARYIFFPYYVPNTLGIIRVGTSNHSYGTAYRGYGSPQAYTASEALMDMMAEKIGMDPFEFRLINVAREGETNINSATYPTYPMEEIMKAMKPYYDEALKEAEKNSTAEKKRGVGIAWGGYTVTDNTSDQCNVSLELAPDGKIIKYDTWQDVGQGGDVGSLHCTLEALKPLGVDIDDIMLIQNDSKFCPDSGPSAASRQHYMNIQTTCDAAEKLMDAMRKEDGTYRTYDEMIAEGIPTRYEGFFTNATDPSLSEIDPNTGHGRPVPEFSYALFLAEVEVDVNTGKTTVLRYRGIDDVGVIGDRATLDGQAYGGMSHSIGFALTENYDDVKKHNNIVGAGVPTIKDIPDEFYITHLENIRPSNKFGSAGASEAYQSGGHMAVINAINNAVGVRIYELPASPEKVKQGIEILKRGEEIKPPEKYYLGFDFYEEMKDIEKNPL